MYPNHLKRKQERPEGLNSTTTSALVRSEWQSSKGSEGETSHNQHWSQTGWQHQGVAKCALLQLLKQG